MSAVELGIRHLTCLSFSRYLRSLPFHILTQRSFFQLLFGSYLPSSLPACLGPFCEFCVPPSGSIFHVLARALCLCAKKKRPLFGVRISACPLPFVQALLGSRSLLTSCGSSGDCQAGSLPLPGGCSSHAIQTKQFQEPKQGTGQQGNKSVTAKHTQPGFCP